MTERFINEGFQELKPENLTEGFVYTGKVWEKNKNNGVQFLLNKDNWHGYSHADSKKIEIGTKEVPKDVKRYFALGEDVPDLEVKKHIFSHENMHHVIFKNFEDEKKKVELMDTLNLLHEIRKKFGRGVSRLGGLDIYKQRKTSHEEDLVELLNMYSQNPKKLEIYLNYLKTADQSILEKNGQVKLNDLVSGILYQKTEKILLDFLSTN